MDAVVADAADDRAFGDFEDDYFCVRFGGGILDAQFHVFEELGIPKRLEVAPESLFIVGIAVAAEDAGFQGVCTDAAGPSVLLSVDDAIFGSPRRVGFLWGKPALFFLERDGVHVVVKEGILMLSDRV